MYKKKYAMFTIEGDIMVGDIVHKALKNRRDFRWIEKQLEALSKKKGFEEATDTHVSDMVWDALKGNAYVL
jgi:hypothetical protein|tara:strand:- start:134 stop:346 length:213 start_codon:yes stop_codon:yes gene_type:complete